MHNTVARKYPLRMLPTLLLLCYGILSLLPYLLVSHLYMRAVQVVIAGLLAMLSRRVQWLYFLSVIVMVVFFHALVPSGLLLWQWKGFFITADAIQGGLYRGLTLSGFVFLSLWMVHPHLHIPGNIGSVLSSMLRYYDSLFSMRKDMSNIAEKREEKTPKGIIALIDSYVAMLLWNKSHDAHTQNTVVSKNLVSHVYHVGIICSTILMWGTFFVERYVLVA